MYKQSLLALLAFNALPIQIQAQEPAPIEYKSKIVHQKEVQLDVELNGQTVLCSRADYAGEFLKILIPALADVTLLDHRNSGAGAPCLGAGMCHRFPDDGLPSPGDIIDSSRPSERITLEITLTRNSVLNHQQKKCEVSLTEEIRSQIRGVGFYHRRDVNLGDRDYQDCLNSSSDPALE